MKNRILTTLILWGLVTALPFFLGNAGAFIFIGFFALGSFYEFLDLLHRAGRPVDRMVAFVAFAILLLGFMVFPPSVILPFAIFTIVFAAALAATFLNSDIGSFSLVAAPTIGSIFILGIPFVSIVLLVHEFGIMMAVWMIAVVKFGDVGALLIGSQIGRTRMAPAYSPKKTWEGLIGGVIVSILVSIGFVSLFRSHLPLELSIVWAAVFALIITLSGVISDLIESAVKREANVKDSGNTLPGIGGFLDLTDSVILAAPVSYFLVWLLI